MLHDFFSNLAKNHCSHYTYRSYIPNSFQSKVRLGFVQTVGRSAKESRLISFQLLDMEIIK